MIAHNAFRNSCPNISTSNTEHTKWHRAVAARKSSRVQTCGSNHQMDSNITSSKLFISLDMNLAMLIVVRRPTRCEYGCVCECLRHRRGHGGEGWWYCALCASLERRSCASSRNECSCSNGLRICCFYCSLLFSACVTVNVNTYEWEEQPQMWISKSMDIWKSLFWAQACKHHEKHSICRTMNDNTCLLLVHKHRWILWPAIWKVWRSNTWCTEIP